jgi:hypothetical protein
MVFRFLIGFVFALIFGGLIPGLHLNNQPSIFPIGFVKIIQSEYAPMGASLAAYLLPLAWFYIGSHGLTPLHFLIRFNRL